MKRIVSWLIASVMLASLFACGGASGGNNAAPANNAAPSATTAAAGNNAAAKSTTAKSTTAKSTTAKSTTAKSTTAKSATTAGTPAAEANGGTVFKPVTYTVYMGDSLNKVNTQWSDTEVGKIIEDKTGVHLDIEYIVGSDEQERASLIVATGDYRDIIIPHNVGKTFVDAGALIPLNDLYDANCPNTQKWWGKQIERVKDVDTGKLWGLSAEGYNAPPLDYPFAAFFMKNAAVAMNGYKTITDPNEYFDVIRQYVKANPTTNGQPTIGFSGPTETWRYVFTLLMAERLYGYPNTGRRIYDPNDNWTVHDRNMMKYRYNYLWTLNQLNQEGLLDPEMFSQTHDEYVAKVASGRVVGFGDEYWEVMDAFALIKQENRINDVYIPFAPMYADRVQGMNDPYAGIQALAIRAGTCISVNAKDPVGILKYLDYLASPEMQELMYWGVEGKDFQKDANGRKYLTAAQYDSRTLDVEFANKTGIGSIGNIAPHPLEMYAENPDGSGVWDPMQDKARAQFIYNDMEKQVLAKLNWKSFTDSTGKMWRSPYGYGWEITIPSDNDRLNEIQATLDGTDFGGENCPSWTQGMVLAKSKAEFDALWDDLQTKLEAAGIQELNDFFTQRARMRVEEFNKTN